MAIPNEVGVNVTGYISRDSTTEFAGRTIMARSEVRSTTQHYWHLTVFSQPRGGLVRMSEGRSIGGQPIDKTANAHQALKDAFAEKLNVNPDHVIFVVQD